MDIQPLQPIIFDLANNVESLNKLEMVRAEIEELRGLLGEKIDPLQALFKEDKFVIHDELKDCRTLLSDLENTLDSNWDYYYKQVVEYKEKYGTVRIPRKFRTDRTQRKRYEGNDNPNLPLSLEQKKKLKLMGIERLIISSVDLGIKYLTEYKKHYGNMHVPVSYVCEDGYRLGSWCSTKRKEYKRGDLDQETIDKLDALDFIWEYDGSEYWEHMYAACKEYYEKHGNIRMPYHYENENGDKLYNWIICIRKRRARQECGDLRPTEAGLTEDQIRRLDELGMKWSVPTGRISNEQMKSIKRPD